ERRGQDDAVQAPVGDLPAEQRLHHAARYGDRRPLGALGQRDGHRHDPPDRPAVPGDARREERAGRPPLWPEQAARPGGGRGGPPDPRAHRARPAPRHPWPIAHARHTGRDREGPGRHHRVPRRSRGRVLMAAVLEVRNVAAAYGDVQALWDVSFDVDEGHIATLLGSNGAGKTTTLRVISGLLPALEGEVVLRGRRISGLAPHAIVDLGVIQVPEGRHLWPNMTVEDNLLLGAYSQRARGQ